ncbi:MAG: Iron(III) dicitrate-binding protein [Pseudomonadota bacterium]|jgi:iron complex transport system substrate-binding protein
MARTSGLKRRAAAGLVLVLLGLRPGVVQAAPDTPPFAVVDDRGVHVQLARAPQRVVTLAPALTESVCALGACNRLVGTDRHSNWPEAVRALPKLGVLEEAQVERIVALRPELVLATASPRAVARLERLGLPVVVLEPRSLDDARRVLEIVARLLGAPATAAPLWSRIQARIDDAAQAVPAGWRGRRVYLEVAATPHAASEASFTGELLTRVGLRNVVPAALGPFPALNPEFVLRAAPELVVATREALAGMPQRPGWSALRALREGHACGFDGPAWDTLVRPGPRVGEGAQALAACLQRLPAVQPSLSVPSQ